LTQNTLFKYGHEQKRADRLVWTLLDSSKVIRSKTAPARILFVHYITKESEFRCWLAFIHSGCPENRFGPQNGPKVMAKNHENKTKFFQTKQRLCRCYYMPGVALWLGRTVWMLLGVWVRRRIAMAKRDF